jgi:hydroxymethylpyrimidine/phosphomethylpyrimidine kinase
MKQINYPCVLSIAGTDPSGGAGIQADIKAISATGCYAASVITALVAQNTQGVKAIQEIPTEFISTQLDCVFSDLIVNAVKIGMLHNEKIIQTIIVALKKYQPENIVLDPVMVAKNGCQLLLPEAVNLLRKELFPLVTLITPNLPEAEMILDEKIETLTEMQTAAKKMGDQFNVNVLLKGGHLQTEQSSDVLYLKDSGEYSWFHADRIQSKNTHGTGCTLSAAIASYLAQGNSLHAAIVAAKKYITGAIEHGKNLQIGKGCGPLNHFYFMNN